MRFHLIALPLWATLCVVFALIQCSFAIPIPGTPFSTPPGQIGTTDKGFVQLNEDATIIVGKDKDGTLKARTNCNAVTLECSFPGAFVISGDVEFREVREDGPISELLRFPEEMLAPDGSGIWITQKVFLYSDNDSDEKPADDAKANPRCPDVPAGLDCNDSFGIPTTRLKKNGNNKMEIETDTGPTVYTAKNFDTDKSVDYLVNSDAPEPGTWLLVLGGLSLVVVRKVRTNNIDSDM